MKDRLTALPLELELGPAIASAAFAVGDHEAVIAALATLSVEGVPERAVAKRRAEFLAGRWAARTALASLGLEGLPGRNDDGSPRWPPAVVGSISHGAERALCAVARESDVRSLGIDVERLMGPETKAELVRRICSVEELSVLGGLAAPQHHLVSFAFSAKESLYKCLYPLVGRFMDFNSARVIAVEGRTEGARLSGELILALSVDWSPELQRGRELKAHFVASEGHVESAVVLLP